MKAQHYVLHSIKIRSGICREVAFINDTFLKKLILQRLTLPTRRILSSIVHHGNFGLETHDFIQE
jgi:hypothetical protein